MRSTKIEANESEILQRILDVVASSLEYCDSSYYSRYYKDDIAVKSESVSVDCIKEILNIIRYTNIEKYMSIWNKVISDDRKQKELQMKAEQMKKAKEIRNE